MKTTPLNKNILVFLFTLFFCNYGFSQQNPITKKDTITLPQKTSSTIRNNSLKKTARVLNDSLPKKTLTKLQEQKLRDSLRHVASIDRRLDSIRRIKDSIELKESVQKFKINRLKDTTPFIRSGNLLTKFVKKTIDLKQGEIITNVLKVVNLGRQKVEFTTDLLLPGGWNRIDDAKRVYVATPKDTTVVPIIITPTKLVNGNTEILVNAFIVNTEKQQLANNYFSLKTKKKVSWELNISRKNNIYFKNDTYSKRIDFSVENTGNYKQDLFINFSVPKNDLYLSDTLGVEIKEPNQTFTLKASELKDFNYIVTAKDLNKRNQRRISLNTYTPNKENRKKTHSLIINTSEPRSNEKSLQKRTKINFIELPNEVEASKFGYANIPLTAEITAQNVLNNRTFMTLNLRGFKQLSYDANLIYSTQLNYSNSFFTNRVFDNMPWYVGYFDQRKTIEVGQISGNLVGISNSGRGIKGSYRFNDKHAAGLFYVNSNGFFEGDGSKTTGGWHKYTHSNNFDITTRFGYNSNKINKRSIKMISFHPSMNFLKKNYVGMILGFTNKSLEIEPVGFKSGGFLLGASYSSNFLKKKLRTNLSARYNDKHFSFSNFERILLNQRTSYEISKNWTSFFSSNYQNIQSYANGVVNPLYNQKLFFNNIVFSTQNKTGTYQPGLYYEYRDFPNNVFHSRGVTFRYSNYNFLKNFMTSLYTKAGYTKPDFINNPDEKDYFTLELSSLARYKTWSVTARYNLGAFSTISSQNSVNNVATPQSIRVSLQNQHLFENRHFAIESNMIYSFNNIFKNHTVGFFPVGYFYTNSGWRFGLSANYTFTSSDFSSVFDSTDLIGNPNLRNLGPSTTSSFNMNFSLRKDFGIPIPFVKNTAASKTFVSFLDVNGNGIKDDTETPIQNVVLQLDRDEVITNIEGKATIKNLPSKNYKLNAFSLEELNGWFPNVKDSINVIEDGVYHIPFVRGVKVFGDVILDRQKIAVADKKPVDLSRIKITAIQGDEVYNTLTDKNGRFEFYLPFGNYVITMDEGILDNRFKISRNNIPLQLKNSQDGVYTSFYIVEKRRKVIFKDFTKKKKKKK